MEEELLKNCHHSGIVLPVPAWLKTKLGRGGYDQHGAVGTIIESSALLDPGADLL